jgi:hypothetical protein
MSNIILLFLCMAAGMGLRRSNRVQDNARRRTDILQFRYRLAVEATDALCRSLLGTFQVERLSNI